MRGRRGRDRVDSGDAAAAAAPLPPVVRFTIEGWESTQPDGDDNYRHHGPPDDLSKTIGVFVHVTDPNDDSSHHYFWAFVGGTTGPGAFQSWEEWYVYVGALMEAHGMGLE